MITVYDRIVMMISGSSQCVRVDSLIQKLGWDDSKKIYDQRRIWSVKKARYKCRLYLDKFIYIDIHLYTVTLFRAVFMRVFISILMETHRY